MFKTRMLCPLLACAIIFSLPVYAWHNVISSDQPLVDFNLHVPNGTTQHGNPRIICTPMTVLGLCTFFAGNFIAHIVTVKSSPGETIPINIFNIIMAFMFPTSGLMRGLNAIVRRVWRGKSELDSACRAGALCVVVRNASWMPAVGQTLKARISRTLKINNADEVEMGENEQRVQPARFTSYHPTWLRENLNRWIYFDTVWGRATVNTSLSKIHGTYKLPTGYSFAILPRNTLVVPRITSSAGRLSAIKSDIASSHSALKVLASVFQLLFATFTLYRHQGDQIDRWGYASFFLVPVPYAIMSLVNGISNLVTPEYSRLYMVHSEVMAEAEEAGAEFDGVVGQVISLHGPEDDDGHGSSLDSTWRGISPHSLKKSLLRLLILMYWQRQNRQLHTITTSTTVSVALGPEPEEATDALSLLLEEESNEPNSNRKYMVTRKDDENKKTIFPKLPANKLRYPTTLLQYGVIGLSIWILGVIIHPRQSYANVLRQFKDIRRRVREYERPHSFLEIGERLNSWYGPWYARNMLGLKENMLGFKENPIKRRQQKDLRPKVSIQACGRFQRQDDVLLCPYYDVGNADYCGSRRPGLRLASKFLTQILCAPVMGNSTPALATESHTSSPRAEKGISFRALFIQLLIGFLLSGLSLTIIGSLSLFDSGNSSVTEQAIMMTWLSTGIVLGLLMPFIDITDMITIFVWIPAYLANGIPLADMQTTGVVFALAALPWSIFIAPIWGLVLVGKMLYEWGNCVTLY